MHLTLCSMWNLKVSYRSRFWEIGQLATNCWTWELIYFEKAEMGLSSDPPFISHPVYHPTFHTPNLYLNFIAEKVYFSFSSLTLQWPQNASLLYLTLTGNGEPILERNVGVLKFVLPYRSLIEQDSDCWTIAKLSEDVLNKYITQTGSQWTDVV